jgi:hypothetical protein
MTNSSFRTGHNGPNLVWKNKKNKKETLNTSRSESRNITGKIG